MGFFAKIAGALTKRQPPTRRDDSWTSALMGYGVPGRDKRLSSNFLLDVLSADEAESLWRSNDIAAKIVEKIPSEAMRRGYGIRMEDKQLSESVAARAEEMQVERVVYDALCRERAFGGSAIFPVLLDDQSSLESPLNENFAHRLSHLQVFDSRELRPDSYYGDPLHPKFGDPRTYRLSPRTRGGEAGGEVLIHESRLIVFPGIRVSRHQVSVDGWGDSVLQRPYEVIRDFGVTWAAVGVMLTDFSQAVIKLEGLAELIAQDGDEALRNRLRGIEIARSTIRATLLDKGEEYDRRQTPVAGLAELLDRFESRLAASAGMPITVLMGRSPAGLNATGESDIRQFYDSVAHFQTLKVVPAIERIIRLVLLDRTGPARGVEPDKWSVRMNSLWQPSDEEIAKTRKLVAETDKIYFDMGAVSAEEIARSRWEGDTYSTEMSVNFAERGPVVVEIAQKTPPDRARTDGAPGWAVMTWDRSRVLGVHFDRDAAERQATRIRSGVPTGPSSSRTA